MPVNLELKIKLSDLNNIYDQIKAIAVDKGELHQVDIYYKNKNSRLKLRLENGTQSLIKYSRNEGRGDRWSDYLLISLSGIDARDYLKDILEEDVVVEKRRRLFIYDNTRIHIDKVKFLGTFLELETLVVNGKKDAGKRFNEIINLLSLNKKDEIKKSYSDMMREKKRK